jgi:hypothetical protein
MACYYPDGSISDGLQPCNTTAGAVSACCRIGDVCLTNGFCFSAGQNSVVRRGCTDHTFNSTECPHSCITSMKPAQTFNLPILNLQVLITIIVTAASSADVVMTPCGDYTYFCCGQDNAARSCCTSGNGTVLLAAGTAILPTATITATTSPTNCPPTNSTTAGIANNCESRKNVVPVGAVAGLGVALGVAVLTVVILAVLWRSQANRVKKGEQRIKELEPLQLMGR